MSDVDQADKVGTQRAVVFYMFAGVLLLQSIFPSEQMLSGFRLFTWIFTVICGALLMTSFGGWLRPRAVNILLNDETTRDHRRTSMAAAFWTTILSSCALTVLLDVRVVPAIMAVRIIVTATLIAALCCFATLELRSAR